MDKIASPQELQAELRRLLAYSEGEQPSRQVLSSRLRELAVRLGAVKTKADFEQVYHQMQAALDTFDLAWSRYEKDPEANKPKLADALKYMRTIRDLADVLIRNMDQLKAG